MTFCAILSYPIEEKVKVEYAKEKTENKFDQQINITHALSVTKALLINKWCRIGEVNLFFFKA